MANPIDWSKLTPTNLEDIEKSRTFDSVLEYTVTYQGHSVSVRSDISLDKFMIQHLALRKMREQFAQGAPPPRPQNQGMGVSAPKQTDAVIKNLINVPHPVRNLVFQQLKYPDLSALVSALGQGRVTEEMYKDAFSSLKTQVEKILQRGVNERILEEILQDHPLWRPVVDAWKVSLEDKIWLLRTYELYILNETPLIPSLMSPSFLIPVIRESITAAHQKMEKLEVCHKGLQKCPKAICLLVNLKHLNLSHNELKTPPDLSQNRNLETLDLSYNPLEAPPNVRGNLRLQVLKLMHNQLINPPDIKQNAELTHLDLRHNQLTTPPDLAQNINLLVLLLSDNKLKQNTPDLSHNIKLQELFLDNNILTVPPDVSRNVALIELDLGDNQLATLPDVSHNLELQFFTFINNPVPDEPDLSNNTKLRFAIPDEPLPNEALLDESLPDESLRDLSNNTKL